MIQFLIGLIGCSIPLIAYKIFTHKKKYVTKDYLPVQLSPYILVIINPIGGRGNGLKIFTHVVAPMLEKANICFKIETTKYPQHGYTIAKTADLTFVTGIIAVGGDGHLHQIVNGLAARPDNINIPIGCIATGTGNGVAKSLGILDPIVSTQAIIDNYLTQINKIEMNQSSFKQIGLLSLTCGFIADFDRLMEKKFRYLPNFCRWALEEIFIPIYLIGLNCRYKVIINIVPKKPDQFKLNDLWNPHSDPIKSAHGWMTFQGEITTLALCNLPFITKNVNIAPKVFENNALDLVILNPISRIQMVKFFLQAEKGEHIFSPNVQYIPVERFELILENDYVVMYDGEETKSVCHNSIECKISPFKIKIFSPLKSQNE
jgi:sphingosine kinase